MKDIILSHYQKVHEIEMNGFTVRVFKPRTMQQLPAYRMLQWVKQRAGDAVDWMKTENTTYWGLGNPDYDMWDAQTVYHYDPRNKAFNIYIAAILVRPFSREAYETYCRTHENIDDINQRLMLMWDSREFDRINGYDQSYGAYKNQSWADAMKYRVSDKERDMADHSPSCYLRIVDDEDEFSPVRRKSVTLRQSLTGEVEYHAVMGSDDTFKDGGTLLMHAAAKCYATFRKEHPEVTEMRFYTDDLVENEEEDEQ